MSWPFLSTLVRVLCLRGPRAHCASYREKRRSADSPHDAPSQGPGEHQGRPATARGALRQPQNRRPESKERSRGLLEGRRERAATTRCDSRRLITPLILFPLSISGGRASLKLVAQGCYHGVRGAHPFVCHGHVLLHVILPCMRSRRLDRLDGVDGCTTEWDHRRVCALRRSHLHNAFCREVGQDRRGGMACMAFV